MDIISYLLELIESRKVVGITALGTLYKKKTPGRYDQEAHAFLPPKYEIAFTNEVKEDQELASYISEKRNISIDSAHFYINEFVEQIQNQLAVHQQATLPALGILKLSDNQLVFIPDSDSLTDSASYGLPEVSANVPHIEKLSLLAGDPIKASVAEEVNDDEITKTFTEDKIAESIAEQPTADHTLPEEPINKADELHTEEETNEVPVTETFTSSEVVSSNENEGLSFSESENDSSAQSVEEKPIEKPAIQSDPEPVWKPTVNQRYEYGYDDDDDENKGRFKRFILKALLGLFIIAVTIGILYLFFPGIFDGVLQRFSPAQQTPEMIDVGGSGPSVKRDSLHNQPDSLLNDTTSQTASIKALPDSSGVRVRTSAVVAYEIIGGAMKTHKKADLVVQDFIRRGIAAKKIEGLPGRRIKISLGSYSDYEPAKKKLDSLKKELKNPELYIQIIKP
ncbi:CCDC81-like prokaryotic HU domain 2 [compost metagenome]